jgi:hypothetical protein
VSRVDACGGAAATAVAGENSNSLFQQPWWLDAVAPNSWGVVTIDRGGRQIGRLPYAIERRFGYTLLKQPPLTQTLGPWIAAGDRDPVRQLTHELEVMEALIAKLPHYDYFEQNLHHSVQCALPFHWAGFTLATRYTHVIEDLHQVQDIGYFRSNIRGDIRKAQRTLSIRSDLGMDTLLGLVGMSFRRQGMSSPYRPELVKRIDAACSARGASRAYFAVDIGGRVHAASYVVWDARTAYYLFGGGDPELRSSGAHSLLLWEAIAQARSASRSFDFEGSMHRSIGQFFRGFNPVVKPFVAVRCVRRRFLPLALAMQLRRRVRRG